jgi:hypothetical protein
VSRLSCSEANISDIGAVKLVDGTSSKPKIRFTVPLSQIVYDRYLAAFARSKDDIIEGVNRAKSRKRDQIPEGWIENLKTSTTHKS